MRREDFQVLQMFLDKGEINKQELRGEFDSDEHKYQLFVTRMQSTGVITIGQGKFMISGIGHLAAHAAAERLETMS